MSRFPKAPDPKLLSQHAHQQQNDFNAGELDELYDGPEADHNVGSDKIIDNDMEADNNNMTISFTTPAQQHNTVFILFTTNQLTLS